MARLSEAMKALKHDIRVVDYNIASGQISKEEWQKYLQSLPDSASNSTTLSIEGDDNKKDSFSRQH